MAGCPDYRPVAASYQQLVYGGPTAGFDCSAWTGAWLVDAHTCGAIKTTGRAIRLASNEPVPDPDSPGLNWPQVDAAVYRVTKGKVNLTLGGTWRPTMSVAQAQTWALNGRPIGVQVNRGALIDLEPDLGAADGFRGGHAIGVKVIDGNPWVFDPLVRIYIPVTWAHLWRGAGALWVGNGVLGQGKANILAARDIVPSSYRITIKAGVRFSRYRVEGGVITAIRGDQLKTATTRVCTRRDSIWYPAFKGYRNVVRLISSADKAYPYVSTDSPATKGGYQEVLP